MKTSSITSIILFFLTSSLLGQNTTFYFEQISSTNNSISFAVKADNFNNIGGMQYSILWDPTLFSLTNTEYTFPSMDADDFNEDFLSFGALGVFWIDETFQGTDLNNGSTLFELSFATTCPPDGNNNAVLTFANEPTPMQTLTVTDDGMLIPFEATYNFITFQFEAGFSVDVVGINATCGEENGAISLNISGGNNYTYLWDNGATTAMIDNLPPGEYSCTITSSDGCEQVINYTLNSSAALNLNSTITNTNCGQSDGNITLQVNGTEPFTYNWNTGDTGPILSNIPNGDYTLTITDGTGCSSIHNFAVTDNPITWIVNNIDITNVSCFDEEDGAISLTISGTNETLNYEWSNNEIGATVNGLSNGSYNCTITDTNGCTLSEENITVQMPTAIEITTLNIEADIDDTASGLIEIEAQGGIPPYTYNWSSGQIGPNIDNLSDGDYFCTVTDSNNCTQTVGPLVVESLVNIFLTKQKTNTLDIFPNPATTIVHLHIPESIGRLERISLIDANGRSLPVLYTIERNLVTWDISNLITGSYVINCYGVKGMGYGRFFRNQ